MTLCALMSSVLVLNSKGPISEELLSGLAQTCRFGEHIEERGNEANRPVLLWALRDLVPSQLQDERGRPIAAEEYLEKALHESHPEREVTRTDQQERGRAAREVRQNVLKFFRDRSCAALAKPVREESQMQRLKDLPYDSLSSEFHVSVESLRSRLIDTCLANPKAVGGQPLGCFTFTCLLRHLTMSMNEGRVLSMKGAWETVQHTTCGSLADELRAEAAGLLHDLAAGRPVPGGARLPLTDEALHMVLRDQRHALKSQWEERAMGDEAVRREYWQELKETLAREQSLVRVQNTRLADQQLVEVLNTWQEWLDADDDGAAEPVERICSHLGGMLEKMPAVPLSRAGRAALQAAARRVSAARSAVKSTVERHGEMQRKAVEWGEQAAHSESAARSELDSKRAELQEVQSQLKERVREGAVLEEDLRTTEEELMSIRGKTEAALEDLSAAKGREHEVKAQQRIVDEAQHSSRSELERLQAAAAKMGAERLASERCSFTAAEVAAGERRRLEEELAAAKLEAQRYAEQLAQERDSLKGETEKVCEEHRQKVEEVRRQLESERQSLKEAQEKSRAEHMRMVADSRKQLEDERLTHHDALDDHKSRLLERERGAGILEGKVTALTSETAMLHTRLKELEAQVRQAEAGADRQSQENARHRAELAKYKEEADEVKAKADEKLRVMEEEHQRRMEDEGGDEKERQPKCGCSIQ